MRFQINDKIRIKKIRYNKKPVIWKIKEISDKGVLVYNSKWKNRLLDKNLINKNYELYNNI